jgi:hypothetical protein
VLDKSCVSCHKPGAENAKAAALDLTPAKSYQTLMNFGGKNLHGLAFEKDRSVVGECAARKSKLLASLPWGEPANRVTIKEHESIKLDADSFNRLVTWMDVYAHVRGHYSDKQEEQLRELKEKLSAMLTK